MQMNMADVHYDNVGGLGEHVTCRVSVLERWLGAEHCANLVDKHQNTFCEREI